MAATLLACGVDPEKSILFQQSTVPMHAELNWILSSITTMARLNRLAQFKEKSQKLKEVPVALFNYPVLQAADILIYKWEKKVFYLFLIHLFKIWNKIKINVLQYYNCKM